MYLSVVQCVRFCYYCPFESLLHSRVVSVGVARRMCGDDGEWVDPPDVLECQSLSFIAIETQASSVYIVIHTLSPVLA